MTSQDFHFRCALLERAKSALAWKAQLTRRAFSLQAFLCALHAVAGDAARSVTKQKACGKQRVDSKRKRNTKKRQLNFKIKKNSNKNNLKSEYVRHGKFKCAAAARKFSRLPRFVHFTLTDASELFVDPNN